MFGFLHRSGMRSPSAAMRRALQADGLPPGTDISTLCVVQSRGWFADRKVTFFRVLDRTLAAAHGADGVTGLAYRDLDAQPDLVLRTGFVEPDGRVVILRPEPTPRAAVQSRERTDPAADERVVLPQARR